MQQFIPHDIIVYFVIAGEGRGKFRGAGRVAVRFTEMQGMQAAASQTYKYSNKTEL